MKVRARSIFLAGMFLSKWLGILRRSVFIPDTNMWAWFNGLFPGPVDANVHVDTTMARSTISDVTGRVVLATRITGQIHRLNIAEPPSGAYVLRAMEGGHHRSATFMKH